ncbi:MAG: hypothetical protein GY763_14255 [Gammaproteobacteria bacterium]|nr:hypothetical protein [Gammaproteobacteria bacterium]
MSAINNHIKIDCKSCKYLSDTDGGGFDIRVPINDKETGFYGSAVLHCMIINNNHSIELKELVTDSSSAPSSKPFLNRLLATLDALAEKRLCGNHSICPPEILQAINKKEVC